jgi:formylglycine-generating enzyme required for sulfatase activity
MLVAIVALTTALCVRPTIVAASSGADCIIQGLSQKLAHGLTLARLSSEITARRARVPEFEFIRKEAEKRGLRVWLFGGTAAGYSHYVKWDLLREAGDLRFQKARFDYDYTNIYRSTQDLDIVVDGSAKQAQELQNALTSRFPYFVGSKATPWEVRSLKEASHDKGAILDDFGFMNQHTDSNSTGMVELTNPPHHESVVRDLRDWQSKSDSQFLKDVHEGQISYYFSKTHEETPRAKSGQNPPIFSVIRALTKAFQYELKIKPEDLAVMKREIEQFDPARDLKNPDTQRWLEKNGKKLFQHAINIEYAWNKIEELGLRKKLIGIKNNVAEEDSLSWWMNKEPLRSKPVGEGSGKTAKELGIDTVAHETNNFLAYESITRAHTGSPNLFISRQSTVGEVAAGGDGFYTALGTKGARGTGITIRFQADPRAREGTDFIFDKDVHGGPPHAVWLNKNALHVIPESLDMSPSEYFELLTEGKGMSKDDEALRWKLKRRLGASIQSGMTDPNELKQVQRLIVSQIKSHAPNWETVFQEWVSLAGSISGKKTESILNAFHGTPIGGGLGRPLSAGPYRMDPATFIKDLKELTRETTLDGWTTHELIPALLSQVRTDVGDRVIESSILSEIPALKQFGLQALSDAAKKRPSPLLRTLARFQEVKDVEKWLSTPGGKPDEKAALLLSSVGSKEQRLSYGHLLDKIPEQERSAIQQELNKQSTLPLFEKLAKAQGLENELHNSARWESFQMIPHHIPPEGKTFEMGSPHTEVGRNNLGDWENIRQAMLRESFELQATPVTQLQYALVMGENPSQYKTGGKVLNGIAMNPNSPVENLTWNDAQKFIEKLNVLDENYTYRLPKENEWEYAARAGTKTAYSFGDDPERLSEYGWVWRPRPGVEGLSRMTEDVASHKPNPAGLYDVHGNVGEMMQDDYPDPKQRGLLKMIRGGSYNYGADRLRSAHRETTLVDQAVSYNGLRLLRTPKLKSGSQLQR